MERFDSFPLPFTGTLSVHEGVVRPIKPDTTVSAKVVAIGIFLTDDSAYDETLGHMFATFGRTSNELDYRSYRGGCRVRALNAILDLDLHLLRNGTVEGTARVLDINGIEIAMKNVLVVLNFTLTKDELYALTMVSVA